MEEMLIGMSILIGMPFVVMAVIVAFIVAFSTKE